MHSEMYVTYRETCKTSLPGFLGAHHYWAGNTLHVSVFIDRLAGGSSIHTRGRFSELIVRSEWLYIGLLNRLLAHVAG